VGANFMAKNGLEPGLAFAYAAMFLESVGGICIIIGLFTRFFAAALAIEMALALLFVHLPKGYSAGAGGYEYVLLIGIVMFAIAIRGGGPYSVDRMIGKEL
jgi:putative oxidoreductase